MASVLAETFEGILTTKLKSFLETTEIIQEEQAGFRNDMSTSNSFHILKSGFNSKKSSLALFVDFQGAYDTICKKNLLIRRKRNTRKMLDGIGRFLTQRWVKTSWNSIKSPNTVGFPQGSVSSPILFNIYVNDLTKSLKEIGDIPSQHTC
ncbi:uncharacterized protein LOC118181686 [Stegodyphus dumicola]|uniref:uncharacterized protein LOC118181686 n=1 Tax=Stegodyphus dumicola TaxID=202533 RepID=UPI0015AF7309|nr:uncharacterized protein LOC118181686 [Stegodyphus dumicola]